MYWSERKDHRATTCDVCGGKLPRVAMGRMPVMGDEELGVLVGKGMRLGLLLVCGWDCAIEADKLAGASPAVGAK